MADDDDNAWRLCWEVNMLFHDFSGSLRDMTCLWCKKKQKGSEGLSSMFALLATECSAKHCGGRIWDRAVCTCDECDVDLVHRITERKQMCYHDDCQRYMLVNIQEVRRRIGRRSPQLLERYLSLVQKHRFFECAVCSSDIPLDEGPSRPPTSECQHDPSWCSDCLAEHLKVKVRNHEWRHICCPEPGCEASMSGRDFAEFADADTLKAYDEHKTYENLSKNPGFRWCSNQCGYGGILHLENSTTSTILGNDKAETNWRCRKCGMLSCFHCKIGHVDETCEEYRQRAGGTIDNEREMRKIFKRCPKRGCGRYVRKEKGCAHVTCGLQSKGCGTRFCWKCKIIFKKKPGNNSDSYWSYAYKHADDCRMVNGRLEDRGGTVPKPKQGDPEYRDDWDQDPDYVEGESDTEDWL